MTPNLYLYKETETGYEYYVYDYSTQMGLSLFDANTEIRIAEFGATQYKKHGWATEKEIPSLNTVGEAISFITSEEDIGLIDFVVELVGFGTLSTHDDGECHFVMNSKEQCLRLMKDTILPENRGKLINKLFGNPDQYFSATSSGVIVQYRTFKEYLTKNA